jgi:uncharacterized protein YkwD
LSSGPVKPKASPSDPWHVRVKLFRVVVVWLASLAAFSGVAAAIAPAAHADSGSEEAQFLALTNQLRSSLGIQTLAPNAQLTSMARNWSAHMASQGTISHNPSLTSQAPSNWQQLGENVGMGGAVGAIQTAFIQSQHHYENLANGAYNFVGIGVVDSNGTIFVTVDFMAAPSGGASAPRPAAPKATSPPRTAAPATPRATTPRSATPPPTTPPGTTPPPTPVPAPAQTPAAVKGSPALAQVLAQLRTIDS